MQRVAMRVSALLILVFTAAGVWFLANSFDRPAPDTWGFRGFQVVIGLALLVLGVLVTRQRPDNVIGWLLLTAGLLTGFQLAVGEYSRYSLIGGGPDELANWSNWLEGWTWVPIVALLSVGLFSTFPDGRLPSRRWRWVLLVGAAGGALVALGTAVTPTPNTSPPSPFHNPIGLAGQEGLVTILFDVGFLAMVGAMFVSLIALFVRLRSAQGDEHMQLEWVTAASALVPVSLVAYALFPSKVTETLQITSLMAIPAAAGVAILRYRLYDIDLIISRTLVYVPLTAFLAGLYSASVALFQKVFQAVTGDRSDAAIIISALVLAAVFTPAKSWLQAKVDRRFKPDADPDRQLRAFADELSASVYRVDPARLSRRLVDKVRQATQAAYVSMALRVGEQTFQVSSGDAGETLDVLTLPIGVRGASGELDLGSRPSGRPYSAFEREALGDAAAAVATAMVDSLEALAPRPMTAFETAETAETA